MIYLQHILFGILMAYVGLISPGMLNMTALKIRLQGSKKESLLFSFGASVIVFFQAGIALYFADYLLKNAEVIEYLKIAGVVVFFILSILFYKMARKKVNSDKLNTSTNNFIKGVGMSVINMLAIPFYLGTSIFLASEGQITIEHPYILFFILGATAGSFLLFFTYVALAKIIEKRISFIARNINFILSALFLLLGILALYKIVQPN